MNKNILAKNDIVYKIGKKTNNTIQRRLIHDIVNLITNFIYEEIAENKVFTVNKFGSFYQGTKKPRLVWSNTQQKKVMSRPSIEVKFSPHATFSKLLKFKRKTIIATLKMQKEDSDKKKIMK